MKNSKYLFLFALIASCLCFCTPNKEVKDNDEVADDKELLVMAYYFANWRNADIESLPFDKLTHILYSFTEVIDDEMKFKNDSSALVLKALVEKKAAHPHLKVMIACGGWGGSGGFSDMASTPETRKKFVDSALDFIRTYDLDGLDIDWEYPGLPGIGNPHKPEDKENFTALMAELKEGLQQLEKPQLLTFAAAGWENFFNHIELEKVMQHVDYMNLMTYDLSGGRDRYTSHHTNLGGVKLEDLTGTPADSVIRERGDLTKPRSAEKIIDYCMKRGIRPEQLVIGAAFYGKGWIGVPPYQNGLYQKNRAEWQGRGNYANIRENFEDKGGFVRHWDPVAKAPFLYHPADSIFITYEDTMSVRLKTRYALDMNMGGIMFWQLGGDAKEDGLVDAIYREKTRQ